MEDSQELVVDFSRFEESFYRRQDAVEQRKNGRFYTYRSTRIKISRTSSKAPRRTTRNADNLNNLKKKKKKKQDKRIAMNVCAYLRPLKKIKTKKTKKDGSKTERFETRSKDRVKKRQLQELGMIVEEVD